MMAPGLGPTVAIVYRFDCAPFFSVISSSVPSY